MLTTNADAFGFLRMEYPSNKNPYIDKFKSKSANELKQIIDNASDYQKDAVQAAKYLILEDDNLSLERPVSDESEVHDVESLGPISAIENITKTYTADYSLGDFLSILTIAIVYNAVRAIFEYYSGEEWLKDVIYTVNLTIAIVFYLSIHIVYRLEHSRYNGYLGRLLHTLQFVFLVLIIRQLYVSSQNVSLDLDLPADESSGFYFGIVIGFFAILCVLEVLVEFLIFLSKALFNR